MRFCFLTASSSSLSTPARCIVIAVVWFCAHGCKKLLYTPCVCQHNRMLTHRKNAQKRALSAQHSHEVVELTKYNFSVRYWLRGDIPIRNIDEPRRARIPSMPLAIKTNICVCTFPASIVIITTTMPILQHQHIYSMTTLTPFYYASFSPHIQETTIRWSHNHIVHPSSGLGAHQRTHYH